jgi:hypothetical protein
MDSRFALIVSFSCITFAKLTAAGPQLTEAEVIRLANHAAIKQGVKLADYEAPKAR